MLSLRFPVLYFNHTQTGPITAMERKTPKRKASAMKNESQRDVTESERSVEDVSGSKKKKVVYSAEQNTAITDEWDATFKERNKNVVVKLENGVCVPDNGDWECSEAQTDSIVAEKLKASHPDIFGTPGSTTVRTKREIKKRSGAKKTGRKTYFTPEAKAAVEEELSYRFHVEKKASTESLVQRLVRVFFLFFFTTGWCRRSIM